MRCGPHRGIHNEADVFFVRGFGDDRDCGLSVISYASQTFGRITAAERHTGAIFKNGARPNMILTTSEDRILTPEQREQVLENIVKPFVGSQNSGGMMVLEGGFSATPVTVSPADLELLEQNKFSVEEVCRWFGVPPFMVGHTEKSTSWGTGLEQQLIGFAKFALLPYVRRYQGAVMVQLQTREDRRTFRPNMNLDGLLEGDSKSRGEFLQRMVTSGIYTPNEARAKENLKPLEGGDSLRMQQQMVPIMETNTNDPI